MKLMRDLTDDEIIKIAVDQENEINYGGDKVVLKFARAILDAARIKTQDPLNGKPS